MTRIPDWNEAPELWDSIRLGGFTLPGRAEITGGSLGYKEDIVQADGDTNVKVNTLSYRPAELEITVSMWEQAHLDKYAAIMKAYAPRKKLDRRPIEVLHPWLEIYGVTYLYIFDMDLPTKVGAGLYEAKLKLREFWDKPETPEGAGVKTVGVGVQTVPLGEATGGGIAEGNDIATSQAEAAEATPPSKGELPTPPRVSSAGGEGGGSGGSGGRDEGEDGSSGGR